MDDCEIDAEQKTMTCKLCTRIKPFNATTDSYGCWKIATFVTHLKSVHKKPTTNMEPRLTNHVVSSQPSAEAEPINITSQDQSQPAKQRRLEDGTSMASSMASSSQDSEEVFQ